MWHVIFILIFIFIFYIKCDVSRFYFRAWLLFVLLLLYYIYYYLIKIFQTHIDCF